MPRFDPGSVAPSGVVKTPRLKGSVYPVATTRLPASFESASALSTIAWVSGSAPHWATSAAGMRIESALVTLRVAGSIVSRMRPRLSV